MRIRRGWFGHDVFPWHGVARRSVLGDRWPTAPLGRCDGEIGWRADASRRPSVPVLAAGSCQARILGPAVLSDTGIVSRDAALRASWAPTIAMIASVRISSSGSPRKLAAIRG
jgi:hypothetical protein